MSERPEAILVRQLQVTDRQTQISIATDLQKHTTLSPRNQGKILEKQKEVNPNKTSKSSKDGRSARGAFRMRCNRQHVDYSK